MCICSKSDAVVLARDVKSPQPSVDFVSAFSILFNLKRERNFLFAPGGREASLGQKLRSFLWCFVTENPLNQEGGAEAMRILVCALAKESFILSNIFYNQQWRSVWHSCSCREIPIVGLSHAKNMSMQTQPTDHEFFVGYNSVGDVGTGRGRDRPANRGRTARV